MKDRLRSLPSLALLGLASLLALWTFLPPPSSWVESLYSRGLYRWVGALLVPMGDWLPLPLGVLALLSVALAFLVFLVRSLKARKRRSVGWVRWTLGEVRKLAGWLLVGYAAFVLAWGANYRREPVETQLELGRGAVDSGELVSLVEELLQVIRRDLPPPEERDEGRALASIRESMARLLEGWYGFSQKLPRRVKRLPPGSLLAFGITGTTLPVFLEAHADGAMPDAWFLRTAAHELAHVAGFSGEADADLVGVLAGLGADDRFARYAVALHVYSSARARLPRELRESTWNVLPEAARNDLRRRAEVAARYERAGLARLQRRVYDTYLHSQGVEEGIEDYSRAIKLLVLARRKGLLRTAR